MFLIESMFKKEVSFFICFSVFLFNIPDPIIFNSLNFSPTALLALSDILFVIGEVDIFNIVKLNSLNFSPT